MRVKSSWRESVPYIKIKGGGAPERALVFSVMLGYKKSVTWKRACTWPSWYPDLNLASLQNCGQNISAVYEPSSLAYFVTAAQTDWDIRYLLTCNVCVSDRYFILVLHCSLRSTSKAKHSLATYDPSSANYIYFSFFRGLFWLIWKDYFTFSSPECSWRQTSVFFCLPFASNGNA